MHASKGVLAPATQPPCETTANYRGILQPPRMSTLGPEVAKKVLGETRIPKVHKVPVKALNAQNLDQNELIERSYGIVQLKT